MQIHTPIKIFLICFSGFLLSFCAPGYDLWFLAWIGLSPLFIIINTSSKLIRTILYSFLFGFSYNFCYLHWLFSIHPLNWLGFNNFQSFLLSFIALIVVTTYSSLFFVLFTICIICLKHIAVKPYDRGIPNFLLVTFLWLIIFNKLSGCKILFGFPWTLIEYSQYKNLFLIQIAEYFGSVSISFLIVFFNLVLANFILWLLSIEKIGNRYIPRDPGQFGAIVSGFVFILILISLSLVCGSFLHEKQAQQFSNESKSICILQGNLPIKATRGGQLDIMLAKKTYDDLISNNEATLIVAPEGSLPTIFNLDSNTKYWVKATSIKKQAEVIFGTYCKNEDTLTNCAVAYSLSKNKFSFYEKERLVPFGEFTPFSSVLPSFLKRLSSLTIGEGFSEGRQTAPINTALGKIGINVCFELIFPVIIRKHALEGANLLINLSDLSWFSSDCTKQQFLAFAVFRAVENRKPVILATNNGISAFIEPSGKIKSQSLPNTQGVLLDWVNPNNKITFFAKYGW